MEKMTQVLEGAVTSFFVGLITILILILIGYVLKRTKFIKEVKKHRSSKKK